MSDVEDSYIIDLDSTPKKRGNGNSNNSNYDGGHVLDDDDDSFSMVDFKRDENVSLFHHLLLLPIQIEAVGS